MYVATVKEKIGVLEEQKRYLYEICINGCPDIISDIERINEELLELERTRNDGLRTGDKER